MNWKTAFHEALAVVGIAILVAGCLVVGYVFGRNDGRADATQDKLCCDIYCDAKDPCSVCQQHHAFEVPREP